MCQSAGGKCGAASHPLLPHRVISTQSTQDPILEALWKFYPHTAASRTASFTGYRHPLLYLRTVCHYRSSEIAPATPGARQAPEPALTRMSTSLSEGQSHTHHRGQDEISIRSQVEMRGSERGWRKLRKKGMKGREVSAV